MKNELLLAHKVEIKTENLETELETEIKKTKKPLLVFLKSSNCMGKKTVLVPRSTGVDEPQPPARGE